MGYELKRFIGEIDKEFLCQICALVLEYPVQMNCGHSFCYECIKSWVATSKTCPLDRETLSLSAGTPVFISPCNAFRNLLYKLDIMCDFEPNGCTTIVKLDTLGDHVKSCEYNLNAKVPCDKGCNLTVSRREYLNNDCSSHLTMEGIKLRRHLNYQKERFASLTNCLYDQVKSLNEELNRQRIQRDKLENVINRQQQEIAKLSSNSSSTSQLKLQICHNLKIDDSNVLRIDDHNSSTFAFAQSYDSVQPANPFFKILLPGSAESAAENVGGSRMLIWIGLTRKGHRIVRNPESESIVCIWNGRIQVDKEFVASGPRWENGDLIKCGIKFPQNFMNNGNARATVYFCRNEELFFEKPHEIPRDGLFPTICIYGKDTTVTFIKG